MAQTHKQTHGHGNSMTNSAKRGRVGENLEEMLLKKKFNKTTTTKSQAIVWVDYFVGISDFRLKPSSVESRVP